MNYDLLSVFVCGCCDCKNKHGMNNTKLPPITESIYHKFSETVSLPVIRCKNLPTFLALCNEHVCVNGHHLRCSLFSKVSFWKAQALWTFTPDDYISERTCLKARNTLSNFKNNCHVFVLVHTGLLEIIRLRTNTLRHFW
jgi:hypothetical protein